MCIIASLLYTNEDSLAKPRNDSMISLSYNLVIYGIRGGEYIAMQTHKLCVLKFFSYYVAISEAFTKTFCLGS